MSSPADGNISRRSFFSFLLVGGGATLLQYLIMALLLWTTNLSATVASSTGFLISAVFNYWANARFTFGGQHDHRASALRFVVTLCAGLAINALSLALLQAAGVPVWLAQLVATGIVFIWNYLINAIWTFRKRQPS
ncbi:MAG: GtrA family protein [Rhodocyclaceae bacterium]